MQRIWEHKGGMLQVQMVEVCCSEENGKKRTKEYPSDLYSRNLEAARQSGRLEWLGSLALTMCKKNSYYRAYKLVSVKASCERSFQFYWHSCKVREGVRRKSVLRAFNEHFGAGRYRKTSISARWIIIMQCINIKMSTHCNNQSALRQDLKLQKLKWNDWKYKLSPGVHFALTFH